MATHDPSGRKTAYGFLRIALPRNLTGKPRPGRRGLGRRGLATAATRRGLAFTLVELAVTVAALSIVAAIAIPGLPRARISANEASAIRNLKTLAVSNGHYRARFGSYPASLSNLVNAGYLDSSGSSPFKAGYTFTYTLSSMDHFEATAKPTRPGETGKRYFFVDETSVIRFSELGPAGGGSPRL